MNQLKIGLRLALAFGLVLAITVAIAAVAVWQLQTQQDAGERVVRQEQQRSQLINEWAANVRVSWTKVAASLKTSDPLYRGALQKEVADIATETTGIQKSIDAVEQDDELRALIAKVGEVRDRYTRLRLDLAERNASGEYVEPAVDEELAPLGKAYLDALAAVQRHAQDELAQAQAELGAATRRSQWAIGLGALAATFVGALFAVLVARSVVRPLQRAAEVAEAIGAGDLSARIEASGSDEAARLLHALDGMQTRLAGIVSEVRRAAEGVATASHEIAHGNSDLSSRTEQQASALQQTAASMEELSATVRQNADNAQQANQLATAASSVATEGGRMVGQVVETMDGISDSSRRISEIIGTIDGIAFQTNILALNAAVEAARAGEQGRGFAVVAGEVRTLAQRAAAAAREIKSLIGTSAERVQTGHAMVDRAGQQMQDVLASIRRVADIVGEISSASGEQRDGVAQIGQAVSQMDQATQQNAALVEQSAAAAESLRSQARQLVDVVAVFRLGGQTGQPAAPAAAVAGARPVTAAPGASNPAARAASAAAAARPPARPADASPAPAAAPRTVARTKSADDDGDWETF